MVQRDVHARLAAGPLRARRATASAPRARRGSLRSRPDPHRQPSSHTTPVSWVQYVEAWFLGSSRTALILSLH